MALINVNLPDADETTILNALLTTYKYQATIKDANGQDTPNPEDPFSFSCRIMNEWFKNMIKAVELPDLSKEDRLTRSTEIDSINITITPG